MNTNYADIVQQAYQLTPDAKAELMSLLQAWLIDERREEIARNVEKTLLDHANGETKNGGIDDLMADLYAED
jgi:hypothetical protein